MRRVHRCLSGAMPHDRAEPSGGRGAAPGPLGPGHQPGASPVCLGGTSADGTPHAEGRGHLRALRIVRRALPHRCMGHGKVRAPHPLCRQTGMIDAVATKVNDCAIKLANVNGTGSASANSLLMQAIFRMGIPVSGKNLFPSNIQGLPTWYEIRVNKDGYTARPEHVDLVVALNPETYAKDVAAVREGGYLLYDSSWPL